MAEETGIEWCDSTHNFWIGCTKVSPGCDHCYAEVSTPSRTQAVIWGPGQPRHRTGLANWAKPMAWERSHLSFEMEHGRRRRVFAQSLSDTFDNEVPDAWRADAFALIEATPHLDWLLLTKRIGNVRKMVPAAWLDAWPNHVRLGISVVNQEEADREIAKLIALGCPNFLSMEPLLGPVESNWLQFMDWVIVGGESGTKARPMHPQWARDIRDQCQAAGVPMLFKQWGEWGDPDSIERTGIAPERVFELHRDDGGAPRHEWPGPMVNGVELRALRPEMLRVGKKASGRLLDGVEHNGYPEVRDA